MAHARSTRTPHPSSRRTTIRRGISPRPSPTRRSAGSVNKRPPHRTSRSSSTSRPGACHSPHHVAKEWADKYQGKFDHGWDRQREITLENQKKLGVVPKDTKLTPRPDSIPAWDSCSPDEKRLYARMQEVFAGFLEHADAQVGRVVDAIEQMGLRDDTLIIYIVGDNGPSAEGSLTGTLNNMKTQLGLADDVSRMLEHIDEIGSAQFENHYPVGWCWAGSSPFQWMKQVASHFGGTRNGLVMSWPGQHHRSGRAAIAVSPRDRHRPNHSRSRRHSRTPRSQWRAAKAHRGHQHGLHLRRQGRPGPASHPVLRDARQPRALPRRLGRRVSARPTAVADGGRRQLRRRHLGAVQHRARTFRRPTTSRTRNRRSCAICRIASWPRPPSTTCCRSTTASPSAPIRACGPATSAARHTSNICPAPSASANAPRPTPRTSTTPSPPTCVIPAAAPRACWSAAAASPAASPSSSKTASFTGSTTTTTKFTTA